MIDSDERAALERSLGHAFRDPGLLESALSHPSWSHEVDGTRGNERLEFLGDAVLDLVVAGLLFEAQPGWSEGDLTRARASLVNTVSLARLARELSLGDSVRLGRTERKTGGADKDTILANVLEALVGAAYLDGGLEAVASVGSRLCAPMLERGARPLLPDPKTRFQEWAHASLRATPRYAVVDDSGLENDADRFRVEVRVGAEIWGEGRGRTKRAAERAAAEDALSRRRR